MKYLSQRANVLSVSLIRNSFPIRRQVAWWDCISWLVQRKV